MNPLISVIVPVFNVEKYLVRCINSIISQTYRNLEIILINDGSTDNSFSICKDFASTDNRIQVVSKLNGGLSSARNAGLEISNGEFIGFVDSDDFIENDMYEKLLKGCLENGAAISMCGMYHIYDDGSKLPIGVLPNQVIWSSKEAIDNLLTWNKIDSSACNKLFGRKLFDNNRFPVGKVCEDVSIIPMILSCSPYLVHIGHAKYYYYQRSGSISRAVFSLQRIDMLDAHKKVADFVKNKFPDLSKKADSFYYHAFLALYLDYFSTDAKIQYPDLNKSINEYARLNFLPILTNRFLPGRNKLFFVLIFTKVYFLLKKCKSALKVVSFF